MNVYIYASCEFLCDGIQRLLSTFKFKRLLLLLHDLVLNLKCSIVCKKTIIVRHYSHLVTTRSPILAFPIDFQFFGWSHQFFSLYQDLLLLAWLLFEELRVVVKVLTTDYWFVAVLLFLFLSKLFTCKAFSPLTFPLFNKMSESFLPQKIFSILAPGYCSLTRIQSQNRKTISTWFVLCGIIHNK